MVGRFIAKLLGELLIGIFVDLTLAALSALFAQRRGRRLASFS